MRSPVLWVPVIAITSLGIGALSYYLTVAYERSEAGDIDATKTVIAQPMSTATSSPKNGFSFNAHPGPRALPELSFVDGEGRPTSLAEFRGRVVLLNIWATWCGPCREEMPTLDRLQALLGGPEFMVLALSIDREGIAVVKDFYGELALDSLAIYVDTSTSAPVELKVLGIPATLLIDREGKEIARVLGPAEWDSPVVVEAIRRYLPAN